MWEQQALGMRPQGSSFRSYLQLFTLSSSLASQCRAAECPELLSFAQILDSLNTYTEASLPGGSHGSPTWCLAQKFLATLWVSKSQIDPELIAQVIRVSLSRLCRYVSQIGVTIMEYLRLVTLERKTGLFCRFKAQYWWSPVVWFLVMVRYIAGKSMHVCPCVSLYKIMGAPPKRPLLKALPLHAATGLILYSFCSI